VKKEVNKFTSLVLVGTAILIRPGIILGGTLQHDCPTSRSIGYFLEPIIRLAPFAKKPIHLTLKGITTDEHDFSVRSILSLSLGNIYPSIFKLGRYFADSDSPSLAVVWHF
jgi:RNA 3'-terminal phosphate cyclase